MPAVYLDGSITFTGSAAGSSEYGRGVGKSVLDGLTELNLRALSHSPALSVLPLTTSYPAATARDALSGSLGSLAALLSPKRFVRISLNACCSQRSSLAAS